MKSTAVFKDLAAAAAVSVVAVVTGAEPGTPAALAVVTAAGLDVTRTPPTTKIPEGIVLR